MPQTETFLFKKNQNSISKSLVNLKNSSSKVKPPCCYVVISSNNDENDSYLKDINSIFAKRGESFSVLFKPINVPIIIPFLFVISNPNYAEIKFSTHFKTEIYIQGTHIYKVLSISLMASSPTEKDQLQQITVRVFSCCISIEPPSFSISAIKRKATGIDILVKHISTR